MEHMHCKLGCKNFLSQSEMQAKTLREGCNNGELREWRKETLQRLAFLDTGRRNGRIEKSFEKEKE